MRQLNLNAIGASAIYKAVSEFTLFETAPERTDRILAALAKADLIIVPKPVGNAEAVREAVLTGNWSAVSERDLLAWRDAPLPGEAVPTGRVVDVTHVKEDGTDETVRHTEYTQRPKETVTLEIGNVVTLPPGTEIRTTAPEPDQGNLGYCLRSADDLASRYDCRVQLVGMDDARFPLSVEDDEGGYVVVTDRFSGRVVGLVEAWHSDDGDLLVPKAWLEIVLSAWDAAKEPQWAA
ncbi:hypothetical protein ABZT49_06125 [Methylobacterium sp. EM32]|uniref:hypothetical protein n=1 Tax=Methylobacterium sp. EM32 TaxID=3163481 RepID=UPI0033A000B8